jgi:hypothetical protein
MIEAPSFMSHQQSRKKWTCESPTKDDTKHEQEPSTKQSPMQIRVIGRMFSKTNDHHNR